MKDEQHIRKLRDACLEFEELLFDHLDKLRKREPKLESLWPRDGDAYDLDLHGDTIEIEWQEYDRCGDYEYRRLEFPLSDLWEGDQP